MTDFADLFDSFTNRAFRFETLPRYAVAEEADAFEAFKAHQPIPAGWLEGWTDFVRESTAAGKSIIRVRVIPEPPTAYFEFERTCGYPQSLQAGETILGVLAHQLPPAANGISDFWLFDTTACATLGYDDAGGFTGATVTERTPDIDSFAAIATELIATARPITDFNGR